MNHFDDEELKCLVEAKKLFESGRKKKDCEKCNTAWRLVDQAILAKYSKLAQEQEGRDG